MTTPPKTREEWEIELSRLTDTLVRDSQWGEEFRRHLDSIMSLQAIADGAQTEIARLTTQAAGYAIERESLQAEVDKTRNENTELLRSLCSANNQIEQFQTAQDEAKDALQAEVERLRSNDVMRLFEADRHNFSTRPCSTCAAITTVTKKDFGCTAMRIEKARQPK
jgi:chromosome segregation ATPase